jgi:hypothetical protein
MSGSVEVSVNGRPLKDQNRWPLLAAIVANVAVFYMATTANTLTLNGISALLTGWQTLLPTGFAFLFTSVANELLGSDAKARLVFWRWRDPLPGSRAFSEYARRDTRVNVQELERRYGPLPREAGAQNALWYRLYRSIANDGPVVQVHRNYLFTRDYATASALILVTLGVAGIWTITSARIAIVYAGLLALQYAVVRTAAKNHGIRFVTTVLAIKSSE